MRRVPLIAKERKRIRQTPSLSILDAVADPQLFGPWFKRASTWTAWFAFMAALFALPMSHEQRRIYRQCTGRQEPPSSPASEAWLVCGRRAGKSFVLALIAVFLACVYDFRSYLSPGERGTVMVIAADRKQRQHRSCDGKLSLDARLHDCRGLVR
jgi:hypothetical protein